MGAVPGRRLSDRRADGTPVYTYDRVAGAPPVGVLRLLGPNLPPGEHVHPHPHAHDFLVLAYFERRGGSLRLGARTWPIEPGDAFVIAPAEVVATGELPGLEQAGGWGVFFPADVLGDGAPNAFLSWRAHPLLFPFARGTAAGAQRLRVPAADRGAWAERLRALERELEQRRDGYAEAALAHLTLLLVDVSRLAADVVDGMRLRDEPLLAEVFAVIEATYAEPITLRDIARAVHLSPGHLTTVVGRKTGRTIQEWIAERRMAEARRLLADTNLTVHEIGRRVGYADASYFTRSFRRRHAVTPLAWRRAGRSA